MRTAGNDILRHLKSLFSKEDPDTSYQLITDFFPAIIYVYDADKKKCKYLNEHRISELLGFTHDDINNWEQDFTNLIFKDDLELVKEQIEKYYLLQDDEDYSYQSRLNHKEGDWRYYRTRGTILRRNEDGKPASLIFLAEDITETYKSEEEAVALKKLMDDTEDLLKFGSWSYDIRIDELYWTDGMYKLLDYKKRDVQSKISNDFYLQHLSEKDGEALRKILQQSIETQTEFEFTHTVTTNNGEEIIVSTKGRTVANSNDEAVKVLGITRDITKQTKINGDLLHYKEMIMEKEEFLNQGSWETNLKTGETNWSKGMYRLFGYDPENGDNVQVDNQLHFLHMSDEEIIRSKEDWINALRDKDNYSRQASITTKDGVIRNLETYGKVIRDARGSAEKVIGTTRDVTRLHEYEKSLEEKIRELNRSNTELEEFAYVASHDLQEPLRKLSTFSERLQTKFSERLGKEGLLYLERIMAATENMRVFIENLLEFSRTARSSKYFTSMNLTVLLDQVKADLELQIEESGTQLHSTLLPTIEIIPSQVKQLFNNLLGNSIKFRKEGRQCEISIFSEQLTSQEKSMYNLKTEKNYYKLSIQDNGIGFEQEYSERIFQIFQRLHGKAEYRGSGIGLAICKKIVDNHNGLISASGQLGKGAVFTVILPENQS